MYKYNWRHKISDGVHERKLNIIYRHLQKLINKDRANWKVFLYWRKRVFRIVRNLLDKRIKERYYTILRYKNNLIWWKLLLSGK